VLDRSQRINRHILTQSRCCRSDSYAWSVPRVNSSRAPAIKRDLFIGRQKAGFKRVQHHGLLDPQLAAGVARVRGVPSAGIRTGNWLSLLDAQRLLDAPDPTTRKGRA
jgi:hypothetical protein